MYASQQRVRSHNLAAVADVVRGRDGCSRAEIGETLGLNKATVSSLVGELISRGLLQNAGQHVSAGPGRPRTIVRADTVTHVCLVVEILTDRVRLSSWTLAATELEHRTLDIDPVDAGPVPSLQRITEAVARWTRRLGSDGRIVAGVAVSVPGLVNTRTGRLVLSSPLRWADVDIRAAFHRRSALRDLPVIVERVANLATVAEWRQAPDREDVVCLHGGETGLGVGVVTAGRLLTGANGRAGGLLFADNVAGAGSRLVSPPPEYLGFVELLDLVRDRASTFSDESTALQDLLRRGDPEAVRALERFAGRLGPRLAALLALFDPAAVLLAGPLAGLADHLTPLIRSHLADSSQLPEVELLAGRAGPEASLIGGAILLADHIFSRTEIEAA